VNVCPIEMDQRKRIAIYGGTFDPVHNGHIEVAQKIVELFDIDKVLFMPALVAPHKTERRVSSAFHRHAMLALTTNDDSKICVSTFELERPERQFTVETLRYFRSEYGQDADLFFVMGADSWSEITTWREWQQLPELANLIVVTRPGYNTRLEHTHEELAARVVDLRDAQDRRSDNVPGTKIYLTDAVMRDVSATEIRSAAASGDPKLDQLVPRAVAQYIRKYGLYRNNE
jgi:nicotinate-nucleotide adenylyltransferase